MEEVGRELIAVEKGNNLKKKYGLKSAAKKGGISCNDGHVLQIAKDKVGICLEPKVQFQLNKLQKTAGFENAKKYDEFIRTNKIDDLVQPYMSDPVQRSLLSYILGKQNVNDIEMLNALVYSGIINTTCPPYNEPNKSQPYTNLITGRTECREPIPPRMQVFGVEQCPLAHGDPYAVEKYINYFGEAECRRPVISGAFSCPPADEPRKIKHITLKNNVGICIEDPRMKKNKDKILVPAHLVYPDNDNSRITKFLQICLDRKFTAGAVKRISELLKGSSNINELGRGLSRDPHYESIMAIVSNIKSPEDVSFAKTALHQFAKALPEYQSELSNIKGMLDFHGIDPSAFGQGGEVHKAKKKYKF